MPAGTERGADVAAKEQSRRGGGSEESISVADLLKRMSEGSGSSGDTEGEAASQRHHRHRRAEGTGLSVSELTGSIPRVGEDGQPLTGRAARRRAREESEANAQAVTSDAAPAAPSSTPAPSTDTPSGDRAWSESRPSSRGTETAAGAAGAAGIAGGTAVGESGSAPATSSSSATVTAPSSSATAKAPAPSSPAGPRLSPRATTTPSTASRSDKTPMPPKPGRVDTDTDLFGRPSGSGSHTGPLQVVEVPKSAMKGTGTGIGTAAAGAAAAGGARSGSTAASAAPEKAADPQGTDRPAKGATPTATPPRPAISPVRRAQDASSDAETQKLGTKGGAVAAAGAGVAGAGAAGAVGAAAAHRSKDGAANRAAGAETGGGDANQSTGVMPAVQDDARGHELGDAHEGEHEGEHDLHADYDTDHLDHDAYDDHDAPRRGGIGQWAILAFQVVAAAIAGAALFVAFELLWSDLKWVALALALVVIIGLVAIVRVLRRGNDWVSIGLAVLVGVGVTFGPLLLNLVT